MTEFFKRRRSWRSLSGLEESRWFDQGAGQNVLREEAANLFAVDDFLDAEGERGGAVVDVVLAGLLEDGVERATEDAVELVEDFRLGPEEALQVLDPLEVADDDAAGVAEDVGDDEDFGAWAQDGVCLDGGGTVRALGENAALEFARVFLGDDAVHRRRDKDFAGLDEQIIVGDFIAAGKSQDAARAHDVIFERGEIESLGIVDAAADVADADDARAVLGHARRGVAADVAEALDDDAAVLGQLEEIDDAIGEEGDAATGGFLAAERAAAADRLLVGGV